MPNRSTNYRRRGQTDDGSPIVREYLSGKHRLRRRLPKAVAVIRPSVSRIGASDLPAMEDGRAGSSMLQYQDRHLGFASIINCNPNSNRPDPSEILAIHPGWMEWDGMEARACLVGPSNSIGTGDRELHDPPPPVESPIGQCRSFVVLLFEIVNRNVR